MKKHNGIQLRSINAVIIILAAVLSLSLLLAGYRTIRGYLTMQEATEDYVASQQDASNLQSGSDYLTEQVRAFVVTGDRQNLDNYFWEIRENRRRDIALEHLEESMAGTPSYGYLSAALTVSNTLAQREYYAVRLTAEPLGYDAAKLPEELREIVLREEDLALSPEEQRELARNMVFDETYQQYKDRISENVSQCTDSLVTESRDRQQESSVRLLHFLRLLGGLVGVLLLLLMFAEVLLTAVFTFRPLRRNVSRIRNQERLPEEGVYELRYLASTYNKMFEQTRESQDQLSYEATHDSLTGLYNRSAFDKFRDTLDMVHAALLLADLDHFKSINDTYGHDIGDLALKKVAEVLLNSFRSEDYVCRIGGDEFAVIMVHAGSELRDLVERKISTANQRLSVPQGNLPAMSLSVGVAFGDREDPTNDMFKDADTALYKAKNGGRRGCAFY